MNIILSQQLQKTIASVNVALGAARGDAGAPKLAAIEAEVWQVGVDLLLHSYSYQDAFNSHSALGY